MAQAHAHDHGTGHGHGHSHGPAAVTDRNARRTLLAALLTGGFMIAEFAGGLIAGSLALIADAAHMLTDTAALGMAYIAFRFARASGGEKMTYGLRRLPILVAFGNGLTLFFIVIWIVVEAVDRLASPVEVLAGPMLAVAIIGLFVNIGAFMLLHGADRTSLNIRGALWHVAGDLLGSIGALAAALIIMTTGYVAADPILSVLVAAIVLTGAWRLTRESAHILLEGAPPTVEVDAIETDLEANVAGVLDIHHVHVWSLTEEGAMATLHARIGPERDGDTVLAGIRARLHEKFGIDHATIQIECEGC